MAAQRPGVGQPRMTVAEEPEHVYGTRKRKNGLPHEHWVYAKIWRMTQQGENALTISEHDNRELGMTADKVACVMRKQQEQQCRRRATHGSVSRANARKGVASGMPSSQASGERERAISARHCVAKHRQR